MNTQHIGSTLDSLLLEDGTLVSVSVEAQQRVADWQEQQTTMNVYSLTSFTDSTICFALVIAADKHEARHMHPRPVTEIYCNGEYIEGNISWNKTNWEFIALEESQQELADLYYKPEDEWCKPRRVIVARLHTIPASNHSRVLWYSATDED